MTSISPFIASASTVSEMAKLPMDRVVNLPLRVEDQYLDGGFVAEHLPEALA